MVSRKMVPLDDDEVEQLARLRQESSVERAALTALCGATGLSEASTLHALVALGLQRVDEARADVGYAALAAGQDEEDDAYLAALRARRAAVVAEEP